MSGNLLNHLFVGYCIFLDILGGCSKVRDIVSLRGSMHRWPERRGIIPKVATLARVLAEERTAKSPAC